MESNSCTRGDIYLTCVKYVQLGKINWNLYTRNRLKRSLEWLAQLITFSKIIPNHYIMRNKSFLFPEQFLIVYTHFLTPFFFFFFAIALAWKNELIVLFCKSLILLVTFLHFSCLKLIHWTSQVCCCNWLFLPREKVTPFNLKFTSLQIIYNSLISISDHLF